MTWKSLRRSISKGPDINESCCLNIAVGAGLPNCVSLNWTGAIINTDNGWKETPLDAAHREGDIKCIELIMNVPTKFYNETCKNRMNFYVAVYLIQSNNVPTILHILSVSITKWVFLKWSLANTKCNLSTRATLKCPKASVGYQHERRHKLLFTSLSFPIITYYSLQITIPAHGIYIVKNNIITYNVSYKRTKHQTWWCHFMITNRIQDRTISYHYGHWYMELR